MEAIALSYRGEVLRMFDLRDRPLEVGSGPGCDIVVHDPTVAERQLLVRRDGDDVVVLDLREERPRPRPLLMRAGVEIALGLHAIVRIPDVPTRPVALMRTEPIVAPGDGPADLSLVVGRGPDARRVVLGSRPVTIGTAASCDVVLHDRAVSGRHCRIEPARDGHVVRDLGSRNGTHVDGVATFVARVGAGTRIRVGRTDLAIVARGESGDARGEGMVAASPAMIAVLGQIEGYARLPWPVLIQGESGSGKEEVARALHVRGPRRDRPFVAVNAGALPHDLVESELFGHEKGAFTGAAGPRRGCFEQAHGGTLFLDEIGELPLSLQPHLLRAIDHQVIRKVGSEVDVQVDVRLVFATHRDLRAMVAKGAFREDLYYRLERLRAHVPPLRERPEDVRALARHFLARAATEIGPRALTDAALDLLAAHTWPGNARELRNVIERAAAASPGVVDDADIERAMHGGRERRSSGAVPITDLVARFGGNLSECSRATGIARTTLRDRLRAEAARRSPR